MTDASEYVRFCAYLTARLLQLLAVLFAVVFVVGALAGGMNILAFGVILLVAMTLGMGVLVVEFVAVRGLLSGDGGGE